jgi:hypothetical protein
MTDLEPGAAAFGATSQLAGAPAKDGCPPSCAFPGGVSKDRNRGQNCRRARNRNASVSAVAGGRRAATSASLGQSLGHEDDPGPSRTRHDHCRDTRGAGKILVAAAIADGCAIAQLLPDGTDQEAQYKDQPS